MIPPLATARTTARDVQLRGVPRADPAVGVGGVDRPRRPGYLDRGGAPAAATARAAQAVMRTGRRRMAKPLPVSLGGGTAHAPPRPDARR